MKNIYKITYLFGIALIIGSCTNDDEKITLNPDGASTIITPSNGQEYILNQFETPTNTALTITWVASEFGSPTEIDYAIEMVMSGSDFTEPITAGSTNTTYFTMNIEEFNSAAENVGLLPFVEGSIDVRIKSTIGTQGDFPQYSNVITLLVTPFTTDLPTIAVPGNHQGWDPSTAPLLASSGFDETDYEGYVWLDAEHKFLAPDDTGIFDWGNIDWGDDGTFTGILVEDDEVNCMADAGYYYVQVDTDALTYSETMYSSWAVTGSATPLGWPAGPDGTTGQDHDMTYDSLTQTWRVELFLTSDEIKFRANDAWGWNYGDTGPDGFLNSGGDNIVVPSAGNYTVVLDLSVPREYTYTLIQN